MIEDRNTKFMAEALAEARKAAARGEVPIGAVIVRGEEIIARGHNLREKDQDPTAHAEIIALKEASEKLGSWRLEDCEIFVTLEPCPMCAGALLQARIKKLVYGAKDPKAGAIVSLLQLYAVEGFNHKIEVTAGVEAEEAARLLREFFRRLR